MLVKLKGKVIRGNEHAKSIGFPTANIKLNKETLFDGIYKVNLIYDSKIFKGIGCARNDLEIFETHILDFNSNIYDEEIEIIILNKIRDNKKFTKHNELIEQIKIDIKKINNKKNYVLTFGTFDLVHEGHKYFLSEAKKYGDILVTILATDSSIEKFKHKKPFFDIETRKKQVKELGVSDIIGIGDENNPLKWLDMYSPSIVCLGYDQIGYSNELEEYKEKNKNLIDIVRLTAYKEDIYKSSLLKNKLSTS